MSKLIKILIISHAFVQEVNHRRWRRLAQDKEYEVHLLVPKYWESRWFSEKTVFTPEAVHDDNFYVHPMSTTSVRNWVKYCFKSLDGKFRQIKPDLIYIIHEESTLIHHQIYLYRKIFAPKAKIIFFSMNAMGVPYQLQKNPLKRAVLKWMWNNIKKNTDAALVHYPGCLSSLRGAGYDKPIYLQTQIGVDEDLFAFNEEKRLDYRKKIGFTDKFVIGFSGRLCVDKGVDDLIAVFTKLAKKYKNIALLLVGDGDLKESIDETLKKERLEKRVHITGLIDLVGVSSYMNAMDIFFIGSKTMPHWFDTFPLVTVQAQAVGLPVIASDSASLPWQLADTASFFNEGDRENIEKALEELINDKELGSYYANKGQKRSHENFCCKGMTKNFKKIVEQIINGEYIFHEKDEKYTQWKAY